MIVAIVLPFLFSVNVLGTTVQNFLQEQYHQQCCYYIPTTTMLSKLITVVVVLPSLLLAVSFAQSTFHVKPTADTPCSAEPCLTLSEYAQAGEQYFTSNTTFAFLPR